MRNLCKALHSPVTRTIVDTPGLFRINFYTEQMCDVTRQRREIHVFISERKCLSTVLADNLLPKVQFETSL